MGSAQTVDREEKSSFHLDHPRTGIQSFITVTTSLLMTKFTGQKVAKNEFQTAKLHYNHNSILHATHDPQKSMNTVQWESQ